MNLGFIGVGNLASAIIRRIVEIEVVSASCVYAYDIDNVKLQKFAEQFGFNAMPTDKDVVRNSDTIVIAVKPADFPDLISGLTDELKLKNPLIISTAAGNSLQYIASFMNYTPSLVRIMPNINATIGEAMSAYCSNGHISENQEAFVVDLCSAIGKVIKLDEKYFPMFGVVAGAAPAFAYMFIDELARAGVKIGINKKIALEIAAQTVLGSAKYILESDEHPYELIDRVCSPGGTTIEGIAALQEFGFANAVTKAVDRSLEKDRKLESLKDKSFKQ